VPQISEAAFKMTGEVLEVVAASWTVSTINQTSTHPCAQNNISISITPDIDVDRSCVHTLTVTGLVGSTTGGTTVDLVPAETSTAVFGGSAGWDRAAGQLTVSLAQNLVRDTSVYFQFELQNRAESQGAQAISIRAPVIFPESTLTGSDIMKIDALVFSNLQVTASTPWPCSPNTVHVYFAMSVPLRNACKRTDTLEAYGRFPRLTIEGLTGARNSTISAFSSGDEEFSGVDGVFAHANGSLTWLPLQATAKSHTYRFNFTITNRATKQDAPEMSIRADILTNAKTGMNSGSSMQM
jgi:hypothetical protein